MLQILADRWSELIRRPSRAMGGVLSDPLAVNAGRREIAIGLGAYAAYLAVRQAVWTEAGRARAPLNAGRLIALERRLGLFVEPRIQAVALRAPRIVDALNAATRPATSRSAWGG